MQTQCPHCDTRFRVTESQVNIADGAVRCGVCKEVFNAFDVASQHEHQASLLSPTNNGQINPSEMPAQQPATSTIEDTDLSSELNEATANNNNETENLENDNLESELLETEPLEADGFDLFNDDDSVSKNLVPDSFRESPLEQPNNLISTLLWGVAVLLLSGTLILEYVWFNRDQFSDIPEVQTGLEKICAYIECKDLTIRAPGKIELISRNVYSHPNEKGALVINVTMKNNADFAQPYPIMQVDFSNIRGSIVAARRFHPVDYLQIDKEQLRLLQPSKSVSLSMEIKDPGKDAMTYEFNFL